MAINSSGGRRREKRRSGIARGITISQEPTVESIFRDDHCERKKRARSRLLNQTRAYLLGCWIGPWTDLLSGFRKGHSNEGRAQCLGVHLHSGSTKVVILPSLHIGRLVPINQPFLNHTRSYACTDCARLSTVRSARLCEIITFESNAM